MSDLYNEVMLRRWSIDLVSGRPECFEDAIDVTMISAEDRAAIEAKNADIHAAIEAAEAYLDGEPTDDGYVEVLARLRAGQDTEQDRQIVDDRYNYAVAITLPTEADLARRAMPALKPYQFRAIVELAGLEDAILGAIEAMAVNNVLQILVFSLFAGVALAAIGPAGAPLLQVADALVVLMLQINKHGLIPENNRRLMCLSMFWHFLDVVWIGVFTFVYLMGVL